MAKRETVTAAATSGARLPFGRRRGFAGTTEGTSSSGAADLRGRGGTVGAALGTDFSAAAGPGTGVAAGAGASAAGAVTAMGRWHWRHLTVLPIRLSGA